MKLKRYTDYSLRLLMYLATEPRRVVRIAEIASAYGISRNHLLKIVNQLVALELLETQRGKSGGIRLAHPPREIVLGEVVRQTEGRWNVVDCHSPACPILPACRLRGVLDEARDAFLQVLDRYTLADLVDRRQDDLRRLLTA
jgi:Rrf2 family nitric oxide-sensitive transcriptional repressor